MSARVRRPFSVLVIALLAIGAPRALHGATLYGVNTAGNFVVGFDSAAPSVPTSFALISGVQPGERIAGIDFRPRTGQLYALGIVPGATDTVFVATATSTATAWRTSSPAPARAERPRSWR